MPGGRPEKSALPSISKPLNGGLEESSSFTTAQELAEVGQLPRRGLSPVKHYRESYIRSSPGPLPKDALVTLRHPVTTMHPERKAQELVGG